MNDLLVYRQSSAGHFTVDYPYYGLFSSADVTTRNERDELMFECKLLNGNVLLLKKLERRKWIDASLNAVTPLSSIIGMCIDDVLKIN